MTRASRLPQVVSVNVGGPRAIETERRTVTTSIWKTPVSGRVRARGINLEGDVQSDRKNHGGPDKAVYAYAIEDTAFWERHLGRQLQPGAMGENLTTAGVDLNEALIGERWSVGSALLEVSEPRSPCYKLGLRHRDPSLPRAFVAAQCPGAYLRIIREGDVGAGDRIEVISRPHHDVTIRLAFQAWLVDRTLVSQLRKAPQLSDAWKDWIAKYPATPVIFE